MTKVAIVTPWVYGIYLSRMLATLDLPDDGSLVRVRNLPTNKGVAASWNQGYRYAMNNGADWLVICSTSVRFGDARGADFLAHLHDPWRVVEAGAGMGWHLIAFHREVLEAAGEFDENFYPAYWEDNDYGRRLTLLGFNHGELWAKPEIDATVERDGGALWVYPAIKYDPTRQLAYYEAKWGGEPGREMYERPFDSRPLGYWPEPNHKLQELLPVLIDIEESLTAQKERQNHEHMLKTVEDVERYERALEAAKPDVIVELGTFSGWSAAWFSRFAEVITVDSDARNLDPSAVESAQHHITYLHGDSTTNRVAEEVEQIVAGRRAFVVLDSDHSSGHVHDELLRYAHLVSPGSYCVVEDGIVRWMPNNDGYMGSPLDAIEWFFMGRSWWERDVELETMSTQSQFPAGWWKHV